MTPEEQLLAARLLHHADYEGPWERLEGFFLGVRRRDLSARWMVRDGSLLDRLGCACGQRDIAWHRRHLDRGTTPWPLWRRRQLGHAPERRP